MLDYYINTQPKILIPKEGEKYVFVYQSPWLNEGKKMVVIK